MGVLGGSVVGCSVGWSVGPLVESVSPPVGNLVGTSLGNVGGLIGCTVGDPVALSARERVGRGVENSVGSGVWQRRVLWPPSSAEQSLPGLQRRPTTTHSQSLRLLHVFIMPSKIPQGPSGCWCASHSRDWVPSVTPSSSEHAPQSPHITVSQDGLGVFYRNPPPLQKSQNCIWSNMRSRFREILELDNTCWYLGSDYLIIERQSNDLTS